MSSSIVDSIKEQIRARHHGDEKQLEVVFSPFDRILVEAPAGYGKTNTMVSKIAYMLATQKIPYPKRLLALTFSVNSALKIKKDVCEQVPNLLKNTGLNISIGDKIFVSNYHGFCRSLLKKYGYLLHVSLFDIDKLQSLDDSDTKRLLQSVDGLSSDDANCLSNYNSSLKNIDEKFLIDNFNQYNAVVIKELLPRNIIPYNAILTLTIKLFIDYPKILEFYQRYYTTIIVDEYQDTNTLSYWLINRLINKDSKVILLGDSLQRIYGFIGAVPSLLSVSEKKFDLKKIQLDKNYRFASNTQMLLLDSNIRRNAENPYSPSIKEDAVVELRICPDQDNESLTVSEIAFSLIQENSKSKVAVLVKQRGPNVNKIIEQFDTRNIPYFFCLFTDEDSAYLQFHRRCLFEFIALIASKNLVTKKLSKAHVKTIKNLYSGDTINNKSILSSLLILLGAFWGRIFSHYSFLSNEDKITLIKDTFENNGLKQYIEFVGKNITISTVHAAKGLEWDFVILPDMEQDSFPNWIGLCKDCNCKATCNLIITKANESRFLEELSVFYVAVTRARKKVFFTASQSNLDKNGISRTKNLSCFLKFPGISISQSVKKAYQGNDS